MYIGGLLLYYTNSKTLNFSTVHVEHESFIFSPLLCTRCVSDKFWSFSFTSITNVVFDHVHM